MLPIDEGIHADSRRWRYSSSNPLTKIASMLSIYVGIHAVPQRWDHSCCHPTSVFVLSPDDGIIIKSTKEGDIHAAYRFRYSCRLPTMASFINSPTKIASMLPIDEGTHANSRQQYISSHPLTKRSSMLSINIGIHANSQ